MTGERARRKYYWDEHARAYRRIAREGKTAWDDLHGGAGFDAFSHRAFLERALPTLPLPPDPAQTRALEVGCGTGPGACFLAARGYRVDGIDLIPEAIALARRFAAGRSRCKPGGFYLVATAMYDPARVYGPDERYDAATGTVYAPVGGDPEDYESAVRIGGDWYQPSRRHLTPPALAAELEGAGFRVLRQEGALGGEVVCALAPDEARPAPRAPRPTQGAP